MTQEIGSKRAGEKDVDAAMINVPIVVGHDDLQAWIEFSERLPAYTARGSIGGVGDNRDSGELPVPLRQGSEKGVALGAAGD